MNTKEYLNKAYRLEEIIESKFNQINKLKELLKKANIVSADFQELEIKKPENMSIVLDNLNDLAKEVIEDTNELINIRREISRLINKIEKKDYKMILELRFLENLKWCDIANRMYLAERWVRTLCDRAILEIEKLREKENEKSLAT